MTVAQIDGLSGTGKSTLSIELERRGYCAVDADGVFAYFADPTTGQPSDDFGKDVAELAAQLALNRDAGPKARSEGMITIDATRPIADVADDILRFTDGDRD